MAVRVDAIDQTMNITAVDMASGVIMEIENRVQRLAVTHEEVAGRMDSQWTKLVSTWGKAVEAFEVAWALADQAAKLEQAQMTFNATVRSMGMNAEAEFNRIRQMSGGLIDDKALYESANKALAAGVPIQQLGTLFEISQAKAREMGTTAGQAFDDIVKGIGDASPSALRHLGLVIDEEKAYRTYAQSVGKAVTDLTSMDKQQALVNATMLAGQEVLNRQNLSQMTASERMQQLEAIYNNLKTTIGSFLIDAGFVVYGLFQAMSSAALALFAGLMKIGQGYEWLQSKISFGEAAKQHAAAAEEMRINSEAAWNAAKDLADQAAKNVTEPFVKARKEAAVAFQATVSTQQQAADQTQKEGAARAQAERVRREKQAETEKREAEQKVAEEKAREEAKRHEQEEADRQAKQQALERERQYREQVAALDQEFDQIKKQQQEAAWQEIQGLVGQVGGETGKGLGMLTQGLQGMADIASGEDPYSAEIERLTNYHNQKLSLMAEHGASLEEIDRAVAEKQLQIEQQKNQQKLAMASNAFGTMAGLMYTLAQTQGKHSKAAFVAYKAFAIGQTIIDTYKAAQGAYSALAGIPIVGPALGAAAAAAAIIAGMARVKSIQSQQAGEGATASAGVDAGGGGGAGTISATPSGSATVPETPATQALPPTQVVNLHVYGNIVDHDAFARELVPAIQKATSDGVR